MASSRESLEKEETPMETNIDQEQEEDKYTKLTVQIDQDPHASGREEDEALTGSSSVEPQPQEEQRSPPQPEEPTEKQQVEGQMEEKQPQTPQPQPPSGTTTQPMNPLSSILPNISTFDPLTIRLQTLMVKEYMDEVEASEIASEQLATQGEQAQLQTDYAAHSPLVKNNEGASETQVELDELPATTPKNTLHDPVSQVMSFYKPPETETVESPQNDGFMATVRSSFRGLFSLENKDEEQSMTSPPAAEHQDQQQIEQQAEHVEEVQGDTIPHHDDNDEPVDEEEQERLQRKSRLKMSLKSVHIPSLTTLTSLPGNVADNMNQMGKNMAENVGQMGKNVADNVGQMGKNVGQLGRNVASNVGTVGRNVTNKIKSIKDNGVDMHAEDKLKKLWMRRGVENMKKQFDKNNNRVRRALNRTGRGMQKRYTQLETRSQRIRRIGLWCFCNDYYELRKPFLFLAVICLLLLYLTIGVVTYRYVEEWETGNAIYFMFVMLSTVGYGDISPVTPAGRIVTMVYIFIAILVLSTALGLVYSYILDQFERVAKMGEKRASKHRRLIRFAHGLATFAKVLGAFFAMMVILAVGTTVFHFSEGLPWLDAAYFSVVTMSTVGFGDIQLQEPFSKGFNIFYIMSATGVMAICISSLANVFISHYQSRVANRVIHYKFDMKTLNNLDQNEDGKITESEFIEFVLLKLGRTSIEELALIKRQFKAMDYGANHTIRKADVEQLDQALNPHKE